MAWWEVAMTVEEGLMEETDSRIAAFDPTKAFDYMNREVLATPSRRRASPQGSQRPT